MTHTDPISPWYYRGNGDLEAIDVIEAFFPHNFCLANTFKYLARAGKKNDEVEDLRKAAWYLNRYIDTLTEDDASYFVKEMANLGWHVNPCPAWQIRFINETNTGTFVERFIYSPVNERWYDDNELYYDGLTSKDMVTRICEWRNQGHEFIIDRPTN